ncbi:MAG: hypothetical protein HY791_33625 [Deltaproteobacteria bacterium]|nr:hypothetical protein [Deltaproteobacteria bacterium]
MDRQADDTRPPLPLTSDVAVADRAEWHERADDQPKWATHPPQTLLHRIVSVLVKMAG